MPRKAWDEISYPLPKFHPTLNKGWNYLSILNSALDISLATTHSKKGLVISISLLLRYVLDLKKNCINTFEQYFIYTWEPFY